jgi:CheY-like chemotaxis protein
MTEEVKRRCLEPFFTTKGERGSGLGLAMVYGVVERHEGTVEIDTILGQGTTFSFSFPPDRSGLVPQPAVPAKVSRPLRVLVVDDHPILTEILAETLSRDWHTVTTAMNGRDAFEKFQREDFDLVITDTARPEMNGDQLAAAIKARAPALPIIMLTGFGNLKELNEEISEFVDHVLTKPATNAELRAAITAVLCAA